MLTVCVIYFIFSEIVLIIGILKLDTEIQILDWEKGK